jgi:hypothetical protein
MQAGKHRVLTEEHPMLGSLRSVPNPQDLTLDLGQPRAKNGHPVGVAFITPHAKH